MTPRAQERDVMGEAHTPGPWKVWSSLYTGMAAAVVRDVEPLETVAEVRAYRNATLIAAAPDLLGAAKPLVEMISAYAPSVGEDDDEEVPVRLADLKNLRAAIAKAEGRTP